MFSKDSLVESVEEYHEEMNQIKENSSINTHFDEEFANDFLNKLYLPYLLKDVRFLC